MAANVNNYVSAGNAAVRSAVQSRQALAENKARLDKIALAAISEDAKSRVNTATNNAKSAVAELNAKTSKDLAAYEIENDKKISSIKRGARKAGMLAGGAALLGTGAIMMNRKEEPNEILELIKGMENKYAQRALDAENEAALIRGETYTPDNTKLETAPVPKGQQGLGVLGGPDSIFQQGADIVGYFESDSSGGYNAYNLGGSDGGHTAHGSGNSSDGTQFGAALTSLPIGTIKQLQAANKLHAAGRYQFIGNSLPEAAQIAGLSDDSLFTPENQDKMFMSFGKKYGPSRWVGLSKATPDQRSIVQQAFDQWQY